MAIKSVPASPHSWWRSRIGDLVLVALLLLALVASFALAARTPWRLDQPTQPYDWTITL